MAVLGFAVAIMYASLAGSDSEDTESVPELPSEKPLMDTKQ
jgi:hypothetical protein